MDEETIPVVPDDQRPKRLPHSGITVHLSVKAKNSGWSPIDVRLMPNVTDGDRAECLKAYLEGIRLGTIRPDSAILKFLELECRVYGLSTGKAPPPVKKQAHDSATIDQLLDFGTQRAWSVKESEKPQKAGRGPGRPKQHRVASKEE